MNGFVLAFGLIAELSRVITTSPDYWMDGLDGFTSSAEALHVTLSYLRGGGKNISWEADISKCFSSRGVNSGWAYLVTELELGLLYGLSLNE